MSLPSSALTRVFENGVDAAAARLGKLSNTKWEMQTVALSQFGVDEYSKVFALDSTEGFGVQLSVPGVTFILFFSTSSAETVCRAFLGASYKPENQRAAIGEIGNIVVNAVADSVGDASGEILLLLAPRVAECALGELMKRSLESFKSGTSPLPIVSRVNLMAEALSADCSLVALMTSEMRARLESSGPRPA